MTIGAISFQPYVYNVNAISSASMNRLSRISDDVLDKKTDYSGLTQTENENPLRRGQTLDFRGMLEMQMQRGRSNAARVMKPQAENTQTADRNMGSGNAGSDITNFRMQQAINAYEMFMTA